MKVSDMKPGKRYSITTTREVEIERPVYSYDTFASGRDDNGKRWTFDNDDDLAHRTIYEVKRKPKEPKQVGTRVKRYFSDGSGSVWVRVEENKLSPITGRFWQRLESFTKEGVQQTAYATLPVVGWEEVISCAVKVVLLEENEVEL